MSDYEVYQKVKEAIKAIEDYKNARNLDQDNIYLARIEKKLVELQNK